MHIISILFQLIGSLGLLLYGMTVVSEGIQKSAGQSLHRVLGMITNNRFIAVLTGLFITLIIQSSSATTVMVVSFVNAGLLTLTQSVGIIFGANIGTTVTAWIVALFGFKYNITALAIPLFGIGYILKYTKKIRKENIGEAFMGLGLLFLGLKLLSQVIPSFSAENVDFLVKLQGTGTISIFLGVISGILITILLHSSSAATAIILTMSFNGLLQWEFAAAMVLGSNIGTTIDAVLASIGTKVNARRAALIHVLFNVTGTFLAVIFLHPLLALVDIITPGTISSSITTHIAMLHTVFNIINTLLFLPFTKPLAQLTVKLIQPRENDIPENYRFDFISVGGKDSVEAHFIQVEKEIADMIAIAINMFNRIRSGFSERNQKFINENFQFLKTREDYTDQMQEQISNYLIKCSELPLTERQKSNTTAMLHIVDEIENITDECWTLAIHLKRSIDKKMKFSKSDMEGLKPYIDLVQQLLNFVSKYINQPLSQIEMNSAQQLENQIDLFRKNLKKRARKRLEKGADVKTELLYIDIVRVLEKIGDYAFSISEGLFQKL